MSNRKPNYEIRVEGKTIYTVNTKYDHVALEATIELINKEGNFTGIELVCTKNGRKRIIARFKGK